MCVCVVCNALHVCVVVGRVCESESVYVCFAIC